ncbi:MAG: hypothetical protein ACNA8R_02750 [Nitriliruptoraceae bacterium]
MNRPEPPDEAFLSLEDEARHAAEVAARSERHQRLQRASEVATWTGTLEDLAERRLPVVLRVAGGRAFRGNLVAAERALVALRSDADQLVVVRTEAVRLLRPQPGVPVAVAMGDRQRVAGRRMVEVLQQLTEERTRVLLGVDGIQEPVAGRLRALGEDVVTLELDDATPRALVYLPISAVQDVVVDP